MLKLARNYIKNLSKQVELFEDNTSNFLYLNQTEFVGVYYKFLYETLHNLFTQIGFAFINPLLTDLAIIRIVEPASKLRSVKLIEDYFGIKHRRQNYYNYVSDWLTIKNKVEYKAVRFAQKNYDFNYELVFYDVTTLYFESFTEDELRKNGFSKDNKSQQPQILVALMVTKEGFPISYKVFQGNTFEGHTIIPVIENFMTKHKVNTFTVVADAAMISHKNITKLKAHKLHYIVGARLGNLTMELINQIDKQITRKDGNSIRLNTPQGDLICSFSKVRYRKDYYEMQKQIQKAKHLIENPGKRKKLKFTTTKADQIELNEKLIEKTTKILGIKGYYTNLKQEQVSNDKVIDRYHQLYKIEQAFRVTKNDLKTRPIFHFKENTIQLHLTICFMALVASKHIELKTELSIKEFIYQCKKITDARMLNKINKEEINIRAKINPKLKDIVAKIQPLT